MGPLPVRGAGEHAAPLRQDLLQSPSAACPAACRCEIVVPLASRRASRKILERMHEFLCLLDARERITEYNQEVRRQQLRRRLVAHPSFPSAVGVRAVPASIPTQITPHACTLVAGGRRGRPPPPPPRERAPVRSYVEPLRRSSPGSWNWGCKPVAFGGCLAPLRGPNGRRGSRRRARQQETPLEAQAPREHAADSGATTRAARETRRAWVRRVIAEERGVVAALPRPHATARARCCS